MKKSPALIITLVLTLCAVCVGALAMETDDFIGTWYLCVMEYNGVLMNPADMGLEVAIMFNADKTAVMMSPGEDNKEATWVIIGNGLAVYVDGELQSIFILVDKALVSDMNSGRMTFRREKPEPVVIAAVRDDAALEDFNGEWIISFAYISGMKIPAEDESVDINMTIINGQVTMLGYGEELLFQGDVVDGILTTSGEVDGEVADFLFCLHQDGLLSVMFMDIAQVFFQRAD